MSFQTPACTCVNNDTDVATPAPAQALRTPTHVHVTVEDLVSTMPAPFYYIPHPSELPIPTPCAGCNKYYVVTQGEEVGVWGNW
jgi:hypothetical protein